MAAQLIPSHPLCLPASYSFVIFSSCNLYLNEILFTNYTMIHQPINSQLQKRLRAYDIIAIIVVELQAYRKQQLAMILQGWR